MKFILTPAECDVLFTRVRWSVTVEAVVDGDVVVHTPYAEDTPSARACLSVHFAKLRPVRDVLYVDVRYNGECGPLHVDTELVVVMRGVVDGCADKVIEWRGYLAPREWETQVFEERGEKVPTLRLQVSGYCIMHATYSTSFPRKWTGVRIGIGAAGVQRALDEYIY